MEVTLKGRGAAIDKAYEASFNPCFNGSDSKSDKHRLRHLQTRKVSILVLMEVTLKGLLRMFLLARFFCFNPCFNGSDSKRVLTAQYRHDTCSFNPCFNGSDSKRGAE